VTYGFIRRNPDGPKVLAFVEFFGEKGPLLKDISLIEKRIGELGSFIAKLGTGIAGAGAGILAPLTGLFTKAAEHGRDVEHLAEQFGMTTESISGLGAGFEAAGISFENFEGILTSLSSKLLDNDQLLQSFGLNTFRLARIPIADALGQVADKFAKMTNPMQRAQLASQVFGSEWRKLMPYLQDGAAGIARLREEGKGLELDPETAKRGAETMKGLNILWTQFKYTLLEVGQALLPNVDSLKEIVTWLREAGMNVKNWIAQNKETIKVVAAVGSGLLVVGTAFIGIGTTLLAVSTATAGFLSVLAGLGVAISTVVALWRLFVGGFLVGGAFHTAALLGNFQALQGSLGILSEMFAQFGETAKSVWQGIGDAISKGDFSLAFNIAVTGMQLIWAQLVSGMTDIWNKFKASFVDGWHDIVTTIHMLFLDLGGFIIKAIVFPIQEALNKIASALDAVGLDERAGKVRGALGDLAPEGIDERTRGKKKVVLDEHLDDEKKRRESRKADSDAAKAEVDRLKALLDDLKATASEPAFEGGFHQEVGGGGGLSDIGGLSSSVKGGFSAVAAAQQFGVGDKTDRIIEGINTTNERLKGIEGGIKDLGIGLRSR
jgi:hypothetical protein